MRGCVACRSRLGPGWFGRLARLARMRRMPAPARAQQVPGALGITLHLKDHGRARQGPPRWRRRTWLAGASTWRDMTRRDQQWARTWRGLTPSIQICRSAGNSNLATAYKKEEATVVAYLALIQNHAFAYLCPVSSSQDLAVLASSLGELTANVSPPYLKTVFSQSREHRRSAALVSDRSTRVQSQSGYLGHDTPSVTSLNHQNAC